MNQDIINVEEELAHHGILGMKWGVRRYQNKDGTLTPAGKRKAEKMKEKYTELTGKRLIRKPTSKSKEVDADNQKYEKKRIRDMSDQEINDRINRLTNEKRLKDLEAENNSNGQKLVKSIGKDIIGPAAIEAGKSLAKDLILKIGKQKLGLNDEKAEGIDEVYKELKKESEMMNYKYNIHNKKKFFQDLDKETEVRKKEAKDKKREERENAKKMDQYKKMFDKVDKEFTEEERENAKKMDQYKKMFDKVDKEFTEEKANSNMLLTTTALVPYIDNGRNYVNNIIEYKDK